MWCESSHGLVVFDDDDDDSGERVKSLFSRVTKGDTAKTPGGAFVCALKLAHDDVPEELCDVTELQPSSKLSREEFS